METAGMLSSPFFFGGNWFSDFGCFFRLTVGVSVPGSRIPHNKDAH
jgi:hypothetical protein